MSELQKVYIALTVEQHLALLPLMEASDAAEAAGEPVAILGQISRDGSRALFAVLPHDVSMQVLAITNPKYAELLAAAGQGQPGGQP